MTKAEAPASVAAATVCCFEAWALTCIIASSHYPPAARLTQGDARWRRHPTLFGMTTPSAVLIASGGLASVAWSYGSRA